MALNDGPSADRSATLSHAPPEQEIVTREVAAQEELRRKQERWHLAAAATGDLIWDWDVLAGDVTWTGAVQPYFGGGSGSNPVSDYHAWAERVHPEDLPSTRIAARVAMETGADSWEDEYRFRRTEGTYACMLERARIVRDAAGRVVRIVGALRDVSHLKRSEEATLRLAAIVASASDAIVGKTPDGVITSWNAAAERIFGYTEREMLGQSVFKLVPEELHETERALLARVRQGERVDFSVTERFRKDGSRIAVSLTPVADLGSVGRGPRDLVDPARRDRAATRPRGARAP